MSGLKQGTITLVGEDDRVHAAPTGRALTLQETLDLIRPVSGPQASLPDAVDVIIVGAGPIGLTVANLLGSFGLDCLLVEQKALTSDTPKAIAIDDEYMRLLETLKLTDALASHLSDPFGVHFLSPFGFALVKVPGFITPNGFGNRNAVLQPVFEKILLDGCRRYPSVKVCYDASLSAIAQDKDGVTTTVRTASGSREITALYMLACDGARSFVRTTLNIPFPGTRIDEPHLVIDLANFPDQVNHSRFFCNPARPVNSVPAPYGGRRLEFMLSPKDDHQHVLTDQGIRKLVDRHTPYKGVPLHIIRRAIYGFSERIADRLHDGRIFLLGDAAHVMPPFGGQGMNTGARDAVNLCWKLAAVVRGAVTQRAVETYDRERRAHIRAIVDYSVRVGRLANIRTRWLSVPRDAAFALANLLPSIRRYFREMRYVPRPFIKEGAVVQGASADDGITGRVLPRLSLVDPSGRAVSLDDVAGSWFALIGLGLEPGAMTDLDQHPVWRALRPTVFGLNAKHTTEGKGPAQLVVADDRGRALLADHTAKLLVLRPDRVVAGSTTIEDFGRFSDELGALLGCRVPDNVSPSSSVKARG